MRKQISILVLICLSSIYISAQTEKYSAPVKWERYKISDKEVSILLPKLPVMNHRENICDDVETNQYAAYADETVFGMTIVFKTMQRVPDFCSPKRKFDKSNFENRLAELKNSLEVSDETKINQNKLEVIKIENKTKRHIYWLINDFENKRWFEFWIAGADEKKMDVKNFFESIKFEKNVQGIEIGNGSPRTLGDLNVPENPEEKEVSKNSETMTDEKLRIAFKPPPSYTDGARRAQTQGVVRLRVTFLANGGIGKIDVLSGLPYGLTEQAYVTAQKIVFLPPKKNGVTYSVSKIVEYGFTIY